MKIAVRMDDISPNMDWKRFDEFKSILDEQGIKPLIGVVPDNKDPNLNCSEGKGEEEFWKEMRILQEKGWILAMHGYQHIYSTKKGGCFPLNDFSEFAGLPFEAQRDMLAKGKRILEAHQIETDIFMAPAHSYDKNTLRALKELGFQKITDGFGKSPYSWRGLTFYPISFYLSGSLKQKKGCTTMVLHTNTLQDGDEERYREYFSRKSVEWISFEEYLKEKAVRFTPIRRWCEYFTARIKFYLTKLR